MREMRIDGQISAREDMYIDSEVNGPITSDSRVTIGPRGTVHGEIRAREVVVFGRVDSNIEARERVALGAGAEVTGDIDTHYVSVDETAYFRGRVVCRPLDTAARPMPAGMEAGAAARESRIA